MIVICNGMLRSGSTLQYNLAASLLEADGGVVRAGFMGDFAQSSMRKKLEDMRDSDERYIIKTHEPPLPLEFYNDRVKVLFSYRDLRDIAASIRKKWNHPFEQILQELDGMVQIETEMKHVPNLLVQSYGMLYENIEKATGGIAAFLAIRITGSAFKTIAQENAVENIAARSNEQLSVLARIKSILRPTPYDSRSLLHEGHISNSGGKDGDWVNQFNDVEIDILTNRYGDWLIAHGYQLDQSINQGTQR